MKNSRGQSVVEMALITPLVLMALYIPMDFGIAMYQAHLTQNAVREVARIAATQAPTAFDATALRAQLLARLPKYVTVSGAPPITKFTSNPANCMQVITVGVTVTYPFTWYRMVRLMGFNTPNSISITRRTSMHYEYDPCSPTICSATPCTSA